LAPAHLDKEAFPGSLKEPLLLDLRMPASISNSSFSGGNGAGLQRKAGLQRVPFRRKADGTPLRRTTPLNRQRLSTKAAPPSPSSKPTPCAPARHKGSRGTYAGTTAGPAPKSRARRRPRLLELARSMPCLLQVPGVCNHDTATTVACHSNWGEHGKAGARRAEDCYSAWGCYACHAWLDQGDADAVLKRPIFDAALQRQVEWWARIAADPSRSEPDRRAARWAIDQVRLDAAPVVGSGPAGASGAGPQIAQGAGVPPSLPARSASPRPRVPA